VHQVSLKALIVGNGHVPSRRRLAAHVFEDVGLIVAADAGASGCRALGLRPDLVVGDFDSADRAEIEALEHAGVEIRRLPAEKDESDLELALRAAIERGARRVIALGALGGPRVEHALAAIWLLALAAGEGVDLSIVDDRSTLWMLVGGSAAGTPARAQICGTPGDFVSLLPFGGDADGVATVGLRYPLHDEALRVGPSRGLSNELLVPAAMVSCRRGRLLIVHTRRSATEPARELDSEERVR
jgi:thiamine pyrophosphokinase